MNLSKEIENEDTFKDMELNNDTEDIIEFGDSSTLAENQFYVYAIIDKDIEGLTEYFRGYGINISKAFTNIESARNTLIMQTEPTKLIIIDTGSGRFASMSTRKSLIDLIGIGDDNSDIIVFYSDSIIKNEAEYSKDIDTKKIKWYKFVSTPQVLATLLQDKKTDEYLIDPEYIEVKSINFNKDTMGLKDTSYKHVEVGHIELSGPEISFYVAFNEKDLQNHNIHPLEGFKVEI